MIRLLRMTDQFLHGTGNFAVEAPARGRLKWLVIFVVVFGLVYGAVMGCYGGLIGGHWKQIVYSAIKLPILLLVTFLLCLPSFFVLNTVLGLRDDFSEVLRAVVGTQSCIAVVLAGLAPITALFYMSFDDYAQATFFNGLLFFVASVTARIVVRRYYRPLIARTPRHRTMMTMWFVLYIFVGIQMGWVLRPFIGDPSQPATFFRSEAWGNAYLVVGKLIVNVLKGFAG